MRTRRDKKVVARIFIRTTILVVTRGADKLLPACALLQGVWTAVRLHQDPGADAQWTTTGDRAVVPLPGHQLYPAVWSELSE